jgi:hypothetical protein
MSKFFLLSFTALTAFAMADDVVVQDSQMISDSCSKPCNPKPVECKPKPKPCEPCVRKRVEPIALTSSRPCNDIGLYLFADALYWHADVTNSDWAFVSNAGSPTHPAAGANQELAFKWNWGFRVGLGYGFDHDQWDSDIYYTWFRNNAASGSTSQTSFTTPTGGSAVSLNSDLPDLSGITILTGAANTKLTFQVVDWELGCPFYVRKYLSLRPHVGIKGAWIKLTETESYTGSAAALVKYSVSNETKSWGVGPSAGINSNWYFGCGNTMGPKGEFEDRPMFSIFGDVSGALMYGHFKNSHSEAGLTAAGAASNGFVPSGLNRNLMVPVLTGVLGLAWDMCFDCDKMHLGIRAGYELQYWFRQNQRFGSFQTSGFAAPPYSRTVGDLALQGLTIDVRFDF